MKRLLIFAAAVAFALAPSSPAAEAVAKLEVVKASRDVPSQHERIEQGINEILRLLKGAPPKPPVVEPPKPVEPTVPAGDNPFVAWCANGGTVVDYVMLRNGGVWLSPAQEAQAREAGCFASTTAPIGGGGSPATGPFDLGEGNGPVKVNTVNAGQSITLSFTVLQGATRVILHVFGAPGAFFTTVTDSIDGAGEATTVGFGQLHLRDASGIAPGRHTYTVRVDGAGQLGVRLEQQ